MATNPQTGTEEAIPRHSRLSSEEIIRRLQKFPVEVLQAALLVLQMRQLQTSE